MKAKMAYARLRSRFRTLELSVRRFGVYEYLEDVGIWFLSLYKRDHSEFVVCMDS